MEGTRLWAKQFGFTLGYTMFDSIDPFNKGLQFRDKTINSALGATIKLAQNPVYSSLDQLNAENVEKAIDEMFGDVVKQMHEPLGLSQNNSRGTPVYGPLVGPVSAAEDDAGLSLYGLNGDRIGTFTGSGEE
jgi:hypothetical protein